MATYDPATLPDLLPIYYKRIFPYSSYFRWLNYGGVPKNYFSNREFSFTLKDDIYLRYQSFADQQELEKAMQSKCPYKIDIGAVFSHRPKDHKTVKSSAFQAQEKELVFDIDMTDYDDVRNCCSGADICKKCWPLMAIAIKIIDRALREDFGFMHLLWVYSGRRGIHCWVSDEVARKLSQAGRTAIVEYLTVVKGGDNNVKKVILHGSTQHPSIQKAIEITRDYFVDYAVKKQDFMRNDEFINKVVSLVPDEACKKQLLDDDLPKANSSADCWAIIKKRSKDFYSQKDYKKSWNIVEEIMLQYCYPRLDINVSKGVNHLLKSPFCIHPKTGRVCVPLSIETIDKFDPFLVPTVSQLCDELNIVPSNEDNKAKGNRQTSLKESLSIFEDFVKSLENSRRGNLTKQNDLEKDF